MMEGNLLFTIILLGFVTVVPVPSAPYGTFSVSVSASQAEEVQDHPAPTASKDTIGPSVQEAREMIIGTWIEDVDGDIGSYKKGALKWVFTEDGRVRKYRNGSRYATQDYAVVEKYDGQQAPDDIAGYLKFTDQDGEVSHMTLSSIRRDDRFPHLSVGTHGIAGSTETLFFVPARVFE
ncbi:hypothetical protein [Salinibacter ruber]|uniref:hypothetical protein n=1 Tax=Salinibacter ruber TaxID=146919 RepID=UPI002074925B|nr:hypothetical protein [Salinibacter ruber]